MLPLRHVTAIGPALVPVVAPAASDSAASRARLRPWNWRQILVVTSLVALVFTIPAMILWCGPAVILANLDFCAALGLGNLWHLFVLVVGLALVFYAPRRMGVRLGRIRDHLPLLLGVGVLSLVTSALGAWTMTENPFEDAPAGLYLATPLGEELIFRGFAFTLLLWAFPSGRTRVFGLSAAVVGSAVLFGLWHFAMAGTVTSSFVWMQAGYTTFAGLLLGQLRERTNSVLPSVAIHSGTNFIATLI